MKRHENYRLYPEAALAFLAVITVAGCANAQTGAPAKSPTPSVSSSSQPQPLPQSLFCDNLLITPSATQPNLVDFTLRAHAAGDGRIDAAAISFGDDSPERTEPIGTHLQQLTLSGEHQFHLDAPAAQYEVRAHVIGQAAGHHIVSNTCERTIIFTD